MYRWRSFIEKYLTIFGFLPRTRENEYLNRLMWTGPFEIKAMDIPSTTEKRDLSLYPSSILFQHDIWRTAYAALYSTIT